MSSPAFEMQYEQLQTISDWHYNVAGWYFDHLKCNLRKMYCLVYFKHSKWIVTARISGWCIGFSVCVFIQHRNMGKTVEYSSGYNVGGCSGSFGGCPSVHLSVCLFVRPSVRPSICPGFQTSLKTMMGWVPLWVPDWVPGWVPLSTSISWKLLRWGVRAVW